MIDRRGFLKMCGVLGVGFPMVACAGDGDERSDVDSGDDAAAGSNALSDRSVIVVGAGAAGMSAAHLLRKAGVDVRVLEAAPTHGGRIKTLDGFVDFPIPLGGEWLHASADVLERIVDDGAIDVDIEMVGYAPTDPIANVSDGELTMGVLDEWGGFTDLKFVGTTWLGFYDQFIVPGIADLMQFDTEVVRIDATSEAVEVTDADGTKYRADAVIVTVPLQVLKNRRIEFAPPMPTGQRDAIDAADVWGGMKVFIEFSERFYPTFVSIDGTYSELGQKDWYDAAYGQDSAANVLGLFTVGDQAVPYQEREGDELLTHLLAELDELFDGAASRTYVQHVAQNWSAEPFIMQGYLAGGADSGLPPRIREPIAGRVFFAGDAYTSGENWSEVHAAAESASDAVRAIMS